MGSATAASPGCTTGAEFPHNVASIVGESGKARRAGAAAPTMAPAPMLRRRFLRDIDITILRSAPALAAETFHHREGGQRDIGRKKTTRDTEAAAAMRILLCWTTGQLALPGA